MIALFRAVLVWTVILVGVVLPNVQPPAAAALPAATQFNAYHQMSVVAIVRAQRVQSAQLAQAEAWSTQYNRDYDAYQAKLQAEAQAAAEIAVIAARNNHAPPPAYIAKIINDAFSPLGPAAVTWAMRIAWCESRYHPNSVNSDSGATGLFQFMAGTWSGTPWAKQSRLDPVANAQAAAWLYSRYGPGRWTCQG